MRALSVIVAAPVWAGFLYWAWLTGDLPVDRTYSMALLIAIAITCVCLLPWRGRLVSESPSLGKLETV